MKFEIAIVCHNYQHRLCWMLSSLLQQKGDNLPELLVNVGYVKGNGTPTTKQVLDYFESRGLNIKHTAYDEVENFEKRGIVRNRQLKESDSDWIMFGDCDMVVDKEFLSKIGEVMPTQPVDKCLHTGRFSTYLEETQELVRKFQYPLNIENVQSEVKPLKKRRKSNGGAGFCQIYNVGFVKETVGCYVPKRRCRDNAWSKFWKTRSDTWLRRKLGRQKVDLPWFIHLQHLRDNEVGHHLDNQR